MTGVPPALVVEKMWEPAPRVPTLSEASRPAVRIQRCADSCICYMCVFLSRAQAFFDTIFHTQGKARGTENFDASPLPVSSSQC